MTDINCKACKDIGVTQDMFGWYILCDFCDAYHINQLGEKLLVRESQIKGINHE